MKTIHTTLTLLSLIFATASATDCKGCATLDEYNFDKIRTKFKTSVIKFDVAYPYGDKHTVFANFAEEVTTNKDILVGQVGIKDYGDNENEELAKKYGIPKRDDLPVVLLFLEGKRDPIFYPEKEKWDLDSLRTFVKTNSKVYIGLPGCLEKYDKMAAKFIAATDKEKHMKDTEKLSEKEKDDEKEAAETYVKYMKKIIEQGVDFVQQEIARLSKILKEGKINTKKKDQLSTRINILHSFSSVPKDEL